MNLKKTIFIIFLIFIECKNHNEDKLSEVEYNNLKKEKILSTIIGYKKQKIFLNYFTNITELEFDKVSDKLVKSKILSKIGGNFYFPVLNNRDDIKSNKKYYFDITPFFENNHLKSITLSTSSGGCEEGYVSFYYIYRDLLNEKYQNSVYDYDFTSQNVTNTEAFWLNKGLVISMKEESWRIECENIVNDKTIHLEIKFEDLKYLQKTLKESIVVR